MMQLRRGQAVWPGSLEGVHTLKSHLEYQGGAEVSADGQRGTGPDLQPHPMCTHA